MFGLTNLVVYVITWLLDFLIKDAQPAVLYFCFSFDHWELIKVGCFVSLACHFPHFLPSFLPPSLPSLSLPSLPSLFFNFYFFIIFFYFSFFTFHFFFGTSLLSILA
jgi:hypothetical protein